MKRDERYEAPYLDVAEVVTEQGFAVTGSTIDNLTEESESGDFWS